jgi:RNA polymerase sigma-70 factor (ECF subfamily)
MGRFATTNWSVVLKARSEDAPAARGALGELCSAYWYPVYAMVRRYGHAAPDAEDLTQAYFTRFLEKEWVTELRPECGRFRSFLRVSVRNFLHNERVQASAAKRGGGVPPVSLDGATAEGRYALEPVEAATPETLFERAWAQEVLARALDRLKRESGEGEGAERFEGLKGYLSGDEPVPTLRELGETWGIGESSVRSVLHRFRKRLGRLLWEEIAATVADPEEVDGELRHLLTCVGAGGGTPGRETRDGWQRGRRSADGS